MKSYWPILFCFLVLYSCIQKEGTNNQKVINHIKVESLKSIKLHDLSTEFLSNILNKKQYYYQFKSSKFDEKINGFLYYNLNNEIIKVIINSPSGYSFQLISIYIGDDFNIYLGEKLGNGFFLLNKTTGIWYFIGNTRQFSNKIIEIKKFCTLLTIQKLGKNLYPQNILYCSANWDGGNDYDIMKYFLVKCIYKKNTYELDYLYGDEIDSSLVDCNKTLVDYLNVLDKKSEKCKKIYLLTKMEFYKYPIWSLGTSISAADSIHWKNDFFPIIVGKKIW